MKIQMIKWHRRMALVAFISVMLWGVSGLLHPLMTWTNPRPVAYVPPDAVSFQVMEVDAVKHIVERYAPQGFSGLRQIGDMVQLTLPGQAERLYIRADGTLIAQGDRDHAVRVARYYTGLADAEIVQAELVTRFSNQYTYINRYLPVWKISFADKRGISVYVDTATDRLGAITDRRKVILQTLFQMVHTGQWLDAAEPLRLVVVAVMVGLALSVSIAGLYMLVRLRGARLQRRNRLRFAHRMAAYGALLPLLMFPVSGLLHLFVQSPLIYPEQAADRPVFTVDDFNTWPQGSARDVRLVPPGWWRVETGQEVHYTRFSDGRRVSGDEAFVRALRGDMTAPVTLLTGFSAEYGFAYKRLPVWRVEEGDALYFIEAKTGVVAARVSAAKKAESWMFSNLHKWQFLDPLSARISGPGPFKTAFRDAVMVGFIGLALAVAVMGFMIRRKRS